MSTGDARAVEGAHPVELVHGWKALVHRVGVIWRLEAAQMVRPGAVLWAVALAIMPSLLLRAVAYVDALGDPGDPNLAFPGVMESAMFVMIPGVVCVLGLLLTATSAIHSEIENRTWIYLAVRPRTKLAALLGKYLFAVTWVISIAIVASLGVAISVGEFVPPGAVFRIVALSVLACLSYGALYILLGVLFLRIGMVVAIAYTLVIELVLGGAPAVVNQATIAYHLRLLFLRGLPDDALGEVRVVLGDTSGPAVVDVLVILGMTALFIGVSILVLGLRQPAAQDPD